MSIFTVLGRIHDLKPTSKGYKRLTIVYNIPFKTNLLKFNVWDKTLLKEENNLIPTFKEGENVKIEYTRKDPYLELLTMERVLIDSCPICDTFVEAMDAQRIECESCSGMPEDQQKIDLKLR